VSDVCPSAFKAELVGRKPGRADSDSTAGSRKGRGAAKKARAKASPARANAKGGKVTSKVARAAKSKQSSRGATH
jgi:hypothetical protein